MRLIYGLTPKEMLREIKRLTLVLREIRDADQDLARELRWRAKRALEVPY